MRQAQWQKRVPLLSFLLLTSVSACARNQPPVLDPQPDPFLIRFEELRGTTYPSAYEAVEELRPLWIRPWSRRSVGGPRGITVYLDEARLGTLHSLMSVSTETVEEIEWLDPERARERWGRNHGAAVIEVHTRR